MITYAKMMSKDEKQSFFSSIIGRNDYKNQLSQFAIEENKLALLDEYHKFYREINRRIINRQGRLAIKMDSFNKKVCLVCNTKMRYLERYEFWGCPNYQDGRTHTTYNNNYQPYEKFEDFDIKNYLSTIRKRLNLSNIIKSSDLYDFYLANGLECISKHFTGLDITYLFKNYKEVSQQSRKFENECRLELNEIWNTVLYQPGIKYIIDGGKISYCFPDFIVSNSDEVKIYECKSNNSSKKNSQIELYLQCVDFILKQNGDNRKLSVSYLIEDDSVYSYENE
jgi:hypothetical protein